MDYSVFDEFCRRPTWHTGHLSDLRLFSSALARANADSRFCPEDAIAYISAHASDKGIWPLDASERQRALADLLKRAKNAKKRKVAT